MPNLPPIASPGTSALLSLQTNTLLTALLCVRLAPRLVEAAKEYGAKPRVVMANSEFHHFASFKNGMYGSPSLFQKLSSKEHATA